MNKSEMELLQLAEKLHEECVRAEEIYQSRVAADPSAAKKKKTGGGTAQLFGVTVNSAAVLKREEELKILAEAIPNTPEARRR